MFSTLLFILKHELTSAGKKKIRRTTKNNWRRTERLAKDGQMWRNFIAALYNQKRNRQ